MQAARPAKDRPSHPVGTSRLAVLVPAMADQVSRAFWWGLKRLNNTIPLEAQPSRLRVAAVLLTRIVATLESPRTPSKSNAYRQRTPPPPTG